MEWLPVWESNILRFAAVVLASVPIVKYILAPFFRAARAFWRGVKSLTQEVEQVRQLVASQHRLVYRELNTNGGSSLVDKVTRLSAEVGNVKLEQQRLSGAIVAFLFRHDEQFAEVWDYLREEYGLDRRDEEADDE